ncbi:hypothetical protein L1887_60331 [Cichorium endivia]|nr:hypothetical protein L1887_60331 [Cichorium endivia]
MKLQPCEEKRANPTSEHAPPLSLLAPLSFWTLACVCLFALRLSFRLVTESHLIHFIPLLLSLPRTSPFVTWRVTLARLRSAHSGTPHQLGSTCSSPAKSSAHSYSQNDYMIHVQRNSVLALALALALPTASSTRSSAAVLAQTSARSASDLSRLYRPSTLLPLRPSRLSPTHLHPTRQPPRRLLHSHSGHHSVTQHIDVMPKIIYYAIRVGRQTGVFTDWDVAAPLVVGHSGAVHKKFSSRQEAERFVNGTNTEPPSKAANDKPKQTLGKRKSISPPASNPPAKPQPQPKNKRAIAPPPSKKRRSIITPVPSDATSTAGTSAQSTRKTIVYCDGSATGNGKKGARAGYGVWFEDQALHHLNEARRLPGKIQTNNRAELLAIVRAIQLCPNDGPDTHSNRFVEDDSRACCIFRLGRAWQSLDSRNKLVKVQVSTRDSSK